MSYLKIFFVVVSLLLGFIYFGYSSEKIEYSESEKLVSKISLQTARELKEKYDSTFISIGLSGEVERLETIQLSFTLDKILEKNKARKLILECSAGRSH